MRKIYFQGFFLLLFGLFASMVGINKTIPEDKKVEVSQIEILNKRLPLYIGRSNVDPFSVKFNVTNNSGPLILNSVEISFTPLSKTSGITEIVISHEGTTMPTAVNSTFGSTTTITDLIKIKGTMELESGIHFLNVNFNLKNNPDLLTSVQVKTVKLSFKNHTDILINPKERFIYQPAMILRSSGQDQIDTYRIPGLVTTKNGTLIAVYDNRRNNSKDLQEDIDIGMSRSTDGGQTWQGMKVIMDIGEYGGRSNRLNGIGDPCVLYDSKTNTIWVAALWMSGATSDQMLWWASKPGLKPDETGQFILVKSTDDGLSWSQPINITEQIKEPGWQLLLQGPGRGITMKNGTLVFPAQFKSDLGAKSLDGGQYTCHSTIVYSQDSGNTWKIGTGARSNTTESQVVELADGNLMLNMRDDRNRTDKSETNGRAVSITSDYGKTWTKHPSSNSALQEPNCMASLISADLSISGKLQQVLFFSNPDSKTDRNHMTIKASLDGGLTWPNAFQMELNDEKGFGYSCLTMVDQKTIGIVYEGVKELYFQKIAVSDLLGKLVK
ncbi:MAG: exo-alpha-sialidase [Mariniphaga sp.]